MMIHTVKIGEVLWKIADYYNADINDIIKINDLQNPNLLLVGQALLIPTYDEQNYKPTIEVNAFTNIFNSKEVLLLQDIMDYLTYLTPFAYLIREDGTLMPIQDNETIYSAISNRVIPIMSVTNFLYNFQDKKVVPEVLNSTDIINTLINNILNVMTEKGYRGLNVDFENLRSEHRDLYNNFLQVLACRVHEKNFFISVTLPSEFKDKQSDAIYEAYDYESIDKIVDFVILNTYGWGMMDEIPGAILPINEIRRVLEYALSIISSDKIFMGFELYAKDWILPYVPGQEVETISIQEAMNRAFKYKVQINYDDDSQSPFYNYVDSKGRLHEVWFDDVRSAQAKFDIAKSFKIRGLSNWTLGKPLNPIWYLLEDNFRIIKENV